MKICARVLRGVREILPTARFLDVSTQQAPTTGMMMMPQPPTQVSENLFNLTIAANKQNMCPQIEEADQCGRLGEKSSRRGATNAFTVFRISPNVDWYRSPTIDVDDVRFIAPSNLTQPRYLGRVGQPLLLTPPVRPDFSSERRRPLVAIPD